MKTKDLKKLKEIKQYVNDLFDLDITENTRKRDYVDARAMYYELSRNLTKQSLDAIGSLVKRNHASVLHSLKNVVMFLDKKELTEAYLYFEANKVPEDCFNILKIENERLTAQRDRLNSVLKLLPQLESVYDNLNKLTQKQKENINKRNELQFDTIARCLNRIEEIVETENEQNEYFR